MDRGVVVIHGTEAGRYLAMSDEGRLYSSVSTDRTPGGLWDGKSAGTHIVFHTQHTPCHYPVPCCLISDQTSAIICFTSQPTVTDDCYFLERLEENHYNTYMSQKHRAEQWYVGLKKNGKPKLGPRTHIGQKAIFFLPRRLCDAAEWRPCCSLNTVKPLTRGRQAAPGWIWFCESQHTEVINGYRMGNNKMKYVGALTFSLGF